MSDRDHDDPATRRRSVKRTVAVLAVIAAVIYAAFIGRGVFGVGS